jgi:hypothetical protein
MQLGRSRWRASIVTFSLLLSLAACGGGAESNPAAPAGQASTPTGQASGSALDLRGVCPSTIVIQTSWLPDSADGALYSLLGPNPGIDAAKKRVTAPLVAQGKDTGVKLEMRAGGPAIGYTQTSAQMYLDKSIHFGLPHLDEQIQLSRTQPTLGVLALHEIDPQIILWDPAKHPEFYTIKDIGKTDTTVVYFGGDTYMEYLVGAGILKRSQLDGSFDGSPSRFVVSKGEIAQSGYATDHPYSYEHELKQWGKPVKHQLVYDAGYPNYGAIVAVRAADRDKLAPCSSKLVPIIQRAQLDSLSNPERVIDLTLELNEEYRSDTLYSRGTFEFIVKQQKALGLVGNGNDETIGNFDETRVHRMIDITGPIFAAQKKPVKEGLKPSDVVTNEFIDREIGLGTG